MIFKASVLKVRDSIVSLCQSVVHRGELQEIASCTCHYFTHTFIMCACIVKVITVGQKISLRTESNIHPIHRLSNHPLWPEALKKLGIVEVPAKDAYVSTEIISSQVGNISSEIYDEVAVSFKSGTRHRNFNDECKKLLFLMENSHENFQFGMASLIQAHRILKTGGDQKNVSVLIQPPTPKMGRRKQVLSQEDLKNKSSM